jgi:4-hydroxybenzoate polyprenyltransferase
VSGSSLLRALDSIRAADWWAYKIPPLLVTAYAGFVYLPIPAHEWTTVAHAVIAILCVAVFGYVQNDVCDIEADRKGGRPNRMSRLSPVARMMWMVWPAALALTMAWVTHDLWLVVLVGANLLVPTLYSVEPVRLKGRGILGALADAAGVHAIPMAIVARAVTIDAPDDIWTTVFVVSAISWAAFSGLRGIIVHQVVDTDDDVAAGLKTFGGSLGPVKARHLVMRGILPLEMLSLVVFLGPQIVHAPVVGLALVLLAGAETVKVRRRWTMPLFCRGEVTEPYVPILNNEIYEVWLPLAFACQLALAEPVLWLLVAAHVYLFFPNIRTRVLVTLEVLKPA